MARGNATTSRDKMTRWWGSERTMRGNALNSWGNKISRGQRNERTMRGDATASWHDKIGDKGGGLGGENGSRGGVV